MTDREKLLAEAVAVGLILGTDFEKNISNVNLQKKIEEKKAENTDNKSDENNGLGDKENHLQKKIDEPEVVIEKNPIIQRISKCGGYKLKFVNGFEHCATKNKITVEQLKEAIETGKELNGFTYKLK